MPQNQDRKNKSPNKDSNKDRNKPSSAPTSVGTSTSKEINDDNSSKVRDAMNESQV